MTDVDIVVIIDDLMQKRVTRMHQLLYIVIEKIYISIYTVILL